MALKIGIVGLPNVGKSTLFNALTRTAAAQAANFPFCTIEPNIGEVAIPDARLGALGKIAKSKLPESSSSDKFGKVTTLRSISGATVCSDRKRGRSSSACA